MEIEFKLDIAGLGIIYYSPFATSHIGEGEDYLESNFWKPDDVAKHVNDCTIAAFGTGTPGSFVIRAFDSEYPEQEISEAMAAIRLGVEVKEKLLIFKDLYELMDWNPAYLKEQSISLENGFYRNTIYTFMPQSGVLGDNQLICVHFEKMAEKPKLNWQGVPDLSQINR